MSGIGRILLCLGALLCTTGVKADWIARSDEIASQVLEAQARFQPESVASYGMSKFDGEVFDLKAKLVERSLANNNALLDGLKKRLATEQHPRVRQDLEIMIRSLADTNKSIQIHRTHLLPYYNIHKTLYHSFRSLLDPRNDASRYPAALERLGKYVGSTPGYQPIAELAKARSTERFEIEGLIGPYIKELEVELNNAPRYVAGIRTLFESAELEGWQDDFALLEKQLADYHRWLQEEMLPRSRPDNLLPEVVYVDRLRGYGVQASPEQLIEKAQYSYQLLRSEMKALAWQIAEHRGWENKDLLSVLRALKKEQIPQDKVLAIYQERLAAVEEIIRRENLVSLPQRDAVIRLATEAESAAIPAPFMSPPQLINNTGQYGEFVLVQSKPSLEGDSVMDDWSHHAITWALTVHEARPGHELQFSKLVENGTSLARAVFAHNSANSEGWGLYAESIMHEFLPLEGQLFNLYTRLMRAARMFLDPMVNTGKMTHEMAANFLIEQLAMSPAMANSEGDRYAFWAPGQATSYYYGYMNLMRLRTEVEIALGDKFDQRKFHDFLLEQGLLPPALLRDAVLERFTSTAGGRL